ncbi:SDR family NAD(P)-dependent oxidoreductase [bacterium]|nr:SDR family NAD(P)-dependent oxidoreductase [bacterium]
MSLFSAFITGATSGIGLETARLLAPQSKVLFINGRRKDRLEELKKELSKFCEVHMACFNVGKRSEVEAWFSQNQNALSSINILVNNAGLARGTDPVHKAKIEDWDEMIDTNLRGLLYVTRQILPSMVANKNGHIVNLGSVAGRWSYQGGGVYCATKFSVRALSECLRMDLQGTNVRVTNIEPGMVETEFSEVRFRDQEKAKQVYKNMTPLSAKDIAESILWSLQRPAHVNIQEMVIFPTDQASIRDVHRT